jgi:hypothetical protein
MEDQLDWIEVRRLRRQVAQRSADGLDCLLYTSSFVERHIIDHDDVPALKRRNHTLFNVRQEGVGSRYV